VNVLCGILVDCRAHCEQMLSVCLKAFEGAMMPVFRSRCRNNSEAADRRIETRLEG
jgi:hypothetical protein